MELLQEAPEYYFKGDQMELLLEAPEHFLIETVLGKCSRRGWGATCLLQSHFLLNLH